MIYIFTTIILKFINSKTLRLAQRLSEKQADGVKANKRKWSTEKNPCKQVSKWQKEHRARAYFCYEEVIHILKWQRACSQVQILPTKAVDTEAFRSLPQSSKESQGICNYHTEWHEENKVQLKKKTFLQGKIMQSTHTWKVDCLVCVVQLFRDKWVGEKVP